jgi:tRNA (adenine37-N6)-methyltransferase
MSIKITPIGIIHTPHTTKDTCPIQPTFAAEAIGRVKVFGEYEAGLKDIETFSHIYLLYHLDRAGEIEMVRGTFLDDEPHGIYASRHPCRPNGIGMSIVKLIKRDGSILMVQGVDMLDQRRCWTSNPTCRSSTTLPPHPRDGLRGKRGGPSPQEGSKLFFPLK